MASEHRLRIKTLVMVLTMVVCANVGDLMLKRGMTQNGAGPLSLSRLQHAFLMTVTNGTIWIGLFFLTGFLLRYMTGLSWAEYRYCSPAGTVWYGLLCFLAVGVWTHDGS